MTSRRARAITAPDSFTFDAPYSPAILWGGFLLISGQVAIGPTGHLVGPGDIEAQARQAFRNIGALLAAAELTFADVLLVRYYLTDMDAWPVVSRVRTEFLSRPYPAGSAVQVGRLARPEWLLEIEAVAGRP